MATTNSRCNLFSEDDYDQNIDEQIQTPTLSTYQAIFFNYNSEIDVLNLNSLIEFCQM